MSISFPLYLHFIDENLNTFLCKEVSREDVEHALEACEGDVEDALIFIKEAALADAPEGVIADFENYPFKPED